MVSADISQSWYKDWEHNNRKVKHWRKGVLLPPVVSLQSLIMCRVSEENTVCRWSWYKLQCSSCIIISKLLFSHYLCLSTVHRSAHTLSSPSSHCHAQRTLSCTVLHTNSMRQTAHCKKTIWQQAVVFVVFFPAQSSWIHTNLCQTQQWSLIVSYLQYISAWDALCFPPSFLTSYLLYKVTQMFKIRASYQ